MWELLSRAARQLEYAYLGVAGPMCRTSRLPFGALLHGPGSPQGTCKIHSGAHGVSLITIDDAGSVDVVRLPTGVIRWESLEVDVHADTTLDALVERMQIQLLDLSGEDVERLWVVHYLVRGAGPLFDSLAKPATVSELWEFVDDELRDTGRPRRSYSMRRQINETLNPVSAELLKELERLLDEVDPEDRLKWLSQPATIRELASRSVRDQGVSWPVLRERIVELGHQWLS